jgi:predicted amidohydrolase YtcJ
VRVRNTEDGDVELDDGTDREVDAHGGCVIPGLHDHHVHLRALAAASASVDVGPGVDLAAALRSAPGRWVRAVGYAGDDLDRRRLDLLVADRPVRVQHRSGALWILNSPALRAVGLPDDHDGRLFRQDEWLRDRLPATTHDLEAVGDAGLTLGVTAFTDTTPGRQPDEAEALRAALPQRLELMMPLEVPGSATVKLLLDDDTLPPIDELTRFVDAVHSAGRQLAVHCVTRVQLVAALAAGLGPGDRIEHGALIPHELDHELRSRRLTVVTQPNFVAERGEQYARDLDAGDLAVLYRCGSLIRAGIRVLGGTDAPFGGRDPWAAMRAAVHRDLVPEERIDAETALGLFTGDHGWCVLGVPRRVALRDLDPANVVGSVVPQYA